MATSADDKVVIIFLFSQETGVDISCKLSLKETVCMKCQILFPGENKKNISKCHLLKILPKVLSIKSLGYHIQPKYWDTLTPYHNCPKI